MGMGACSVPLQGHLPLGTSNSKASAQLLRPSSAPVFTDTMPNNHCPIPPGGGQANTSVQDLFPPAPAVRQRHGTWDGQTGLGIGRLGLSHKPLPLCGASRRRSVWPHQHCCFLHPPAFHPVRRAANPAPTLDMLLNCTAKCHHA